MDNFDPKTQIAIIWSIDDVKALEGGEKLTDAEAFEVLEAFEDHHEGAMEQMWDDLQYHLREFNREKAEV